MDVFFLALVAHDQTGRKSHVPKSLVQVPGHAEAGAATHPRIYVVLETVIQVAGTSGRTRRFQTDNFREVLVGDGGKPVAQLENLLPTFLFHKTNNRKCPDIGFLRAEPLGEGVMDGSTGSPTLFHAMPGETAIRGRRSPLDKSFHNSH